MEENVQILEQLKKTEAAIHQQTRIMKTLSAFMLICCICCVVAVGLVFRFAGQMEQFLPQINSVMGQLETVLGNLETTTEQLAAMDLEQMVSDVNTLVITGQESLEQTMGKIESIDFDALNEAIDDLGDVIKPLADFFNTLGNFGR